MNQQQCAKRLGGGEEGGQLKSVVVQQQPSDTYLERGESHGVLFDFLVNSLLC